MKAYSLVYISTYEGPQGNGMYCAKLHHATGEMELFIKMADLDRAALMTQHPTKSVLYAVGIDGPPELGIGCIAAYTIHETTGELHLMEKTKTGAGLPTFISTSANGLFLFQASFSTAAVSVLTINNDGSLMPSGQVHRFDGKGSNPIRQTKSHPHCIIAHPQDACVYVSDLGTDKIIRFKLDQVNAEVVPDGHIQHGIALGAGPRIMRFSQDGRHLYIINELHNSISVYAYRGADKPLEPIQLISTLPSTVNGHFDQQMAGEIRLHPSQKYIYATNRSTGEGQYDGISVFKRNRKTGLLTSIQHHLTGKHPRHFNIDPSGRWLLVAARDADQIHRFRIDAATGLLQEVGQPSNFPQPWDIQFYIHSEQHRHETK